MTSDLKSLTMPDTGEPQPNDQAREQVAAYFKALLNAGASSQEIGAALATAFVASTR